MKRIYINTNLQIKFVKGITNISNILVQHNLLSNFQKGKYISVSSIKI